MKIISIVSLNLLIALLVIQCAVAQDISTHPLPELGEQDSVAAALQPNETTTIVGQTFFEMDGKPAFQLSPLPSLPHVFPILVATAARDGVGARMIAPYQSRLERVVDRSDVGNDASTGVALPNEYQPWWTEQVTAVIGERSGGLTVSLNSLIENALRHSPHIQVAATEPHIRQSTVFEEASQFDWTSFLETKYADTNDPIGNTLTTGNNDNRFTQKELYGRGGLRRKNKSGGETEIAQRLGYLDNNSRFLIPPDQGSSRLELNYRHPLYRGNGVAVNESLIVLADIDFRSASDKFLEELQQHLSDVTETYWELVRSRSEYLQRQKLLSSAKMVLQNLEGRVSVDALDRQIFRAKAAVANRRAEIARSLTSIKNAESRLRLLVNEPYLLSATNVEFLPTDIPSAEQLQIDLANAKSTALVNRPDISQAIRDVKAANIRNGIAQNEILPKLDLIVGTYVAGLDGDSGVLNSAVNQFSDGRPGFNVGLEFESPIGNRSALARQNRRELEVNRALHQFRATMETALTEVEIAVREVTTTHMEMDGRYHSMVAAQNETAYLNDRWRILPEIDDSATLLLENVLDSQERLADEESAYARAQFDYAVATVRLKRSMGTLFQFRK